MAAERVKFPLSVFCLICHDELSTDEMDNRTVYMTCKHTFHPSCIREWIITKSGTEDENCAKAECPNCHSKIALNEARPLFLTEDDLEDVSRDVQDLKDLQSKLATSESKFMEEKKLNEKLKLELEKEETWNLEIERNWKALREVVQSLQNLIADSATTGAIEN